MKGVWRLYKNLNIYICCLYLSAEANRSADCSAKMGNCINDSNIWMIDSLKKR